jgi:apoptotic chromatin condensation inducer in the nucleus
MSLNGKPLEILRVVDLKAELEKRGLAKHGNKKDLIARLALFFKMHPEGEEEEVEQPVEQPVEETNDAVTDLLKLKQSRLQDAQQNSQTMPQVQEQTVVVTAPTAVPQQETVVVQEALAQQPEPLVEVPLAPVHAEPPLLVQKEAEPAMADVRAKGQPRQEVSPSPHVEPQEKVESAAKTEQGEKAASPKQQKTTKVAAEEVVSKSSPIDKEADVQESDQPLADLSMAEADSVVVNIEDQEMTFGDDSAADTTEKKEAEEEEEEDDDPHNLKLLKDVEPESSQLVSLRKINRSQSAGSSNGEGEKKAKKTWATTKFGASKNISSQTLKDIVPDIKPLLSKETEVDLERKDDHADEEKQKEEKMTTKRKVEEDGEGMNENEDNEANAKTRRVESTGEAVVRIDNLVRPFTVNQLKELLCRTGKIVQDEFWIDKIKSKCLVVFSTLDEAEETVAALDGVKWPSSNPKQLSVTLSTKEELRAFQSGDERAAENNSRRQSQQQNSKNSASSAPATAAVAAAAKRDEKDDGKRSKKKRREEYVAPKGSGKSLDELFRKTKTLPSIYWLPGKP